MSGDAANAGATAGRPLIENPDLVLAPICEVCGQRTFVESHPTHVKLPRHRAHDAINHRVAAGWVPIIGSALLALRRRGAEIQYDGRRPHQPCALIAWATRAAAEDALLDLEGNGVGRARARGGIEPPTARYLRLVLRTQELCVAGPLPWFVAWNQARREQDYHPYGFKWWEGTIEEADAAQTAAGDDDDDDGPRGAL